MMKDIRHCDVTSIEARYHDCCLPDYFQGSDAQEVLAVPMHEGITYKEAYGACKEEFHNCSGWFDNVAGSGTLAEDALHALFASMLAEDTDKPAEFAKYVEDNEDGDSSYLYVGLYAEEGNDDE